MTNRDQMRKRGGWGKGSWQRENPLFPSPLVSSFDLGSADARPYLSLYEPQALSTPNASLLGRLLVHLLRNKSSSKLQLRRGQHDKSLWLSLFLIFDHNQYFQWSQLYSFCDGMLKLSLIKLLQCLVLVAKCGCGKPVYSRWPLKIKMQRWKINGGKKSMRAHCKLGHKSEMWIVATAVVTLAKLNPGIVFCSMVQAE